MKHAIKNRFTGEVIYECEVPENIDPLFRTRYVLTDAVKSGANLSRADLSGANLSRANLYEANLSRADLSRANLYEANLSGADLYEANLYEANLSRANLSRADLYEANLSRAKLNDSTLIGPRPFFQMGPIGSRNDYLLSFITDQGVYVRAGCFFDTLDNFIEQVNENHGDSVHGKEYRAAVEMIKIHAELWTPENSSEGAA